VTESAGPPLVIRDSSDLARELKRQLVRLKAARGAADVAHQELMVQQAIAQEAGARVEQLEKALVDAIRAEVEIMGAEPS